MTKITRERLLEIIEDGFLKHGESKELARIALSLLEAEPVAWKATFTQIDHEYNTFTAMYSDKAEAERWARLHKIGDFRAEITPLYAAPVVPDGWISCSDAVPADFCDVILHDALGNVFPGSWDKVCRSIEGGYKTAFVDNDGTEVENATHWMPLPTAPQPEANQ